MWTKIKRVIKAGGVSFTRNGLVSVASTLVMTVTLSVILSLLFTGALLQSTLQSIKDKVDVNVYFETTATESQILTLKAELDKQPEVAATTYTSPDQALAQFRARHQDNELVMNALDEIGTNPLEANINIRAKDPSQYQAIADFIQTENATGNNTQGIVSKISYLENKAAIDTLSKIIQSSERLGLIVAIFFILVSILITFNTIRLAIYTSRDEIAVMRLVGASSRYIKGPFVIVGIIYGLLSAIITIALAYPVVYWVGPMTYNLGTGLNLFSYYLSNFFAIAGIVIGAGVVLGIIASYLAVRKYIRV